MATYGHTFTSGDTVTPTKLNNARTVTDIVNADIKSDAAIAGSKIDPSFNAPAVIAVNSASTALRVTQEGAGNALVVEDSTNPDSTPLVINNVGQIISGATTAVDPNSGLQLIAQSSSAPSGSVTLSYYDSSSAGANATFRSQRARGSLSAPEIVQNGDTVGSISFRGYDGTQFRQAAVVAGLVDGSPSTTSMGGAIAFRTTPNGSVGVIERMRITSAGNVGIGTTTPATTLDVNGTVTATAFAGALTGNVTGNLTGTASNIADGTVSTAKIVDGNVTDAKIASGVDASKLTTGTLPIARIADAAVTPAKLSQPYTLATAQNSTSGTSIDFTGIPSWARRITVMFNGVSTNGTSGKLIQIGAGSFVTSGYDSQSVAFGTTTATQSATSGFSVYGTTASEALIGHATLTLVSGNSWVMSAVGKLGSGYTFASGGSLTLSGALDRVRITTVNGTDTFDAGSINIAYEG